MTSSAADLLASTVCAQQGNIMQYYEWPDNNELPPRGWFGTLARAAHISAVWHSVD